MLSKGVRVPTFTTKSAQSGRSADVGKPRHHPGEERSFAAAPPVHAGPRARAFSDALARAGHRGPLPLLAARPVAAQAEGRRSPRANGGRGKSVCVANTNA